MIIKQSFLDYPSPEGSCVSVYFTGCENNCPGCQNEQFKEHNPVDYDKLVKSIEKACKRSKTKQICLLGGDPLYKENIETTNKLITELGSKYDICVYTGYDFDVIKDKVAKGFTFLKTGRYDVNQLRVSYKSDEKMSFASANQCVYDKDFKLLSNEGVMMFNAIIEA